MNRDLLDRLGAPFPAEAVGTRPEITCPGCKLGSCMAHTIAPCKECGRALTTAHVHVDYVGHAYVRERLNEVDPDWNWQPMGLTPEGLPLLKDGCLWIKLTIGGKTHLGVGDAPGQRGGRAWKELIGDAIRNAAMSFGVALEMWMREPVHLDPAPAEHGETNTTDADASTPAPSELEQTATPDEPEELRARIREISRRRGRSGGQTAADFTKWSRNNTQFLRANAALLAEYLDHLTMDGKPR